MNARRPMAKFGVSIILVACSLLLLTRAWAATVVSGNVFGTWTTNGSPYILSADCTVTSNQTLIIQPGATVVMGPDLRLTVVGGITAIGTPELPITIQGANRTNYWLYLSMAYSGFTNRFHHCHISDGVNALYFGINGGNQQMTAEIINCDFYNCRDNGIYGSAQSYGPGQQYSGSAMLSLEIANCLFDSTGNGCTLFAQYIGLNPADACLDVHVRGNIFKNLTGAAAYLWENHGNLGGNNVSRPVFVNNSIVSASTGIDIAYPYFDPVIHNNLFMRTSNALHKMRVESERERSTSGTTASSATRSTLPTAIRRLTEFSPKATTTAILATPSSTSS